MYREAVYYSKMVGGLYRRVKAPPLSDPIGAFHKQVQNRETSFLNNARAVIFANPENPFHRMFQLAGCGYEDLARMVAQDGLEKSLACIQRAGVYLTHDEFKLKIPLVRDGKEIPVNEFSFDNTQVKPDMEGRTSGSRSKRTFKRDNLAYYHYREARHAVVAREFDLHKHPFIALKPILPSLGGFNTTIAGWRQKRPLAAWFSPDDPGKRSFHYRAVTALLVTELRALGVPAPYPTYMPHNDFSTATAFIARLCAQGRPPQITGMASGLVRIAAAALDKHLDIRGCLFISGGEALTEAKRATIEAAGGIVYPHYVVSEFGHIGQACRRMTSGNHVHLFPDLVAVISRKRKAPLSDVEVDSLMFTTVLPFASRVVINTESDDAGTLVPRKCDCTFASLGSDTEIRDIFSYGKLTGQGITLMGSDIVRIMEEDLPRRFGGVPGDYQLVEKETGLQTQIILRVSPRIKSTSREAVREAFLERLKNFYGGHLAERMWTQSEGIQVEFAEPLLGATGKILSLHLLGPDKRRAS